MVNRFYSKYKGTEVVVENVQEDERPEIAAGYRYSSRVKIPNIKNQQITDRKELANLGAQINSGFKFLYADPLKTKKVDLTSLLEVKEYEEILHFVEKAIRAGGSAKDSVLKWIENNYKTLKKYPELASLLKKVDLSNPNYFKSELKELFETKNYQEFKRLYTSLYTKGNEYRDLAIDFVEDNLKQLMNLNDKNLNQVIEHFYRVTK